MVVMDSDLDRLYRDPGQVSSLGGIDRLYNAAKKSIPSLTRDQVIQYLQTQDSYTKQKQIKRKFKRRKTVAVDVNDLYQADLCDMQKFAEFNDNFKYFLSCIDVFSKMGFTVPLKSKKPLEIVNALSSIFRSYGIPLKINFDNGGEFKNATVKAFLKECRVIHYFTRNDDIKCSVVERFNRTIKERLWAYMTQENGYRYIDVLPSVTESYNSSVHSATNFAPVSVGLEESRIIRKQLLADQSISTSHQKFAVDDYVRISVKKGAFEHGFEDSFSSEIFIVTDIINSSGTCTGLRTGQTSQ